MWELYWDSFADNLKVDQALLNVSSSLKTNAWLYQLSDECIAVIFLVLYLIYSIDKI